MRVLIPVSQKSPQTEWHSFNSVFIITSDRVKVKKAVEWMERRHIECAVEKTERKLRGNAAAKERGEDDPVERR